MSRDVIINETFIFGKKILVVDNVLNFTDRFLMLNDIKKELKKNTVTTTEDDYRPNEQTGRDFFKKYKSKSWEKFHKNIINIVESFYNYRASVYQSWGLKINATNKCKNYFHKHNVPVSGVYYFTVPEPEVSLLIRSQIGQASIPSVKNRLILMPGDVMHSPNTEKCKSRRSRYSYAFDIGHF